MPKEERPSAVCESTKQEGEAPTERSSLRSWAEPAAWTEPMLVALEQNKIRGGKWFTLIDKVGKKGNLEAAFKRVKENRGAAGVDHVTPSAYEQRAEENLGRLQRQILDGTYTPQEIRRVFIPKPGSTEKRPLGIPTVNDRVAQAATRQVIEPIFEHEFKDCSYGFRPGRGTKDALRTVDTKLKGGRPVVVDADIRNFFGSVNHDKLMTLVERRIADGRVLALIRQFLEQRVLEDPQWSPKGTPQGAVISPLLANIYLHELDVAMTEAGYEMVRYADDLVILCRTSSEAQGAYELLQRVLGELSLELHPDKTRVVDMQQAKARFEFLGYAFYRSGKHGRIKRAPTWKSERKLHERIKGMTRCTNGESLPCIVARLNVVLKGWFEYFKHASAGVFRDYALDGYIRGRLRRILEKRRKRRKNKGRGEANRRYPNEYFLRLGLFTLEAAHAAAYQSVVR